MAKYKVRMQNQQLAGKTKTYKKTDEEKLANAYMSQIRKCTLVQVSVAPLPSVWVFSFFYEEETGTSFSMKHTVWIS